MVIATGINEDGGREVLGVMVGDSETELFWTQFLSHLRERGLAGVRLMIGDHHTGLVKAIRKVMTGAAYQRCRVHFLRNVCSVIPKGAAEMVARDPPHHLRPARPRSHPPATRHGRRHARQGKIQRRVDVVQVLPNDDALLRLVTAVLFEMDDEWIAFPRRYLPEGSMEQIYPSELPESAPRLPNTSNMTVG